MTTFPGYYIPHHKRYTCTCIFSLCKIRIVCGTMQDNCCPTQYRLMKVNLTPEPVFVHVCTVLFDIAKKASKTHMKMINWIQIACIFLQEKFTISFISVPPQLSNDLVDFIHLHIMVTHYSSTNYIARLLSWNLNESSF